MRIQKAWAVLNKLGVIWKSNLSKSLKLRFFRATVEAVPLYGCKTWTLTTTLANGLDGCYTKLLRVIHGVLWKDNINNKTLNAANNEEYGGKATIYRSLPKKRHRASIKGTTLDPNPRKKKER